MKECHDCTIRTHSHDDTFAFVLLRLALHQLRSVVIHTEVSNIDTPEIEWHDMG